MRQVIVGGTSNNLHETATEYMSLRAQRPRTWVATEENRDGLIGASGRICMLRVLLTNAPADTDSRTFTLFKNGSATALTVTISGTSETGFDDSNVVTVSAGDELSLETDPTGTPASADAYWSVIFESDDNEYSNLIGGNTDGLQRSPLTTEYNYICGGSTWTATETDRQLVVPHSGVLRNFYVKLTTAPDSGAGVQTYTFKVRKNAADTSLVVAISDTDTTGSDTSNSVDVVAGDLICISSLSNSIGITASTAEWGLTFESTADDRGVLMGHAADAPVGNEFNYPDTTNIAWNSNQNARRVLTNPCKIRNLYVDTNANVGEDNTVTTTLMKNGDATSLAVTVSGATSSGNNTTDVVEVGEGDRLSIRHTQTAGGSPPSAPITEPRWGMTVETVVPSLAMRGEGT